MLPDEPELPERPDDPDDPEEPDDPDDPDEPDEPDDPDEPLRPDCPLPLEPDIPPEFPLLPEPDIPLELLSLPEPDIPLELLLLPEPDDPPELSRLPEDPLFWSRSCDELDELPLNPLERSEEELPGALRAPPCELDDPELPPTPPVLEPPDACRSRSDAECPSPCDELPRSRFELPDEALLPLWSLFDEPEVFRSRSAIYKSS